VCDQGFSSGIADKCERQVRWPAGVPVRISCVAIVPGIGFICMSNGRQSEFLISSVEDISLATTTHPPPNPSSSAPGVHEQTPLVISQHGQRKRVPFL